MLLYIYHGFSDFSQFLVLDEADRVLDVGFEEELRVIFNCLPQKRQTFLFSTTKTSTLQDFHEISPKSTSFYEENEGLSTVESVKQQYFFIPKYVKEVYQYHILSRMEDNGIRSAIISTASCKYVLYIEVNLYTFKDVFLYSHDINYLFRINTCGY